LPHLCGTTQRDIKGWYGGEKINVYLLPFLLV